MADRDLANRSEKTILRPLTSDCCCGVGDSSSLAPAKTDKSYLAWRRYCGLALVLSTLSVLLCAVTWSENASVHRRLLLVEERLKSSLAIDDPQFDAKMAALFDNRMMLFAANADNMAGSSSPARSRNIRQVASATAAPAECLCPPGNSSPSPALFFFFFFFSFFFFRGEKKIIFLR